MFVPLTPEHLTLERTVSVACRQAKKEPQWWRVSLLLDEITRKSFKKSFGARCQCCDTSHPHGLDLRTWIVCAGIARRETRDERRRGESYSAGLTAQARRESCQFRSDPRVRVPETAGLALVSTRIPPLWVLISITTAVWKEFRTNSHAFFLPRRRRDKFVLSACQSGAFRHYRTHSNFRYRCLGNSTLFTLMMVSHHLCEISVRSFIENWSESIII